MRMIVTRKLTCRPPLFPLICCFWGLFEKMSLDAKILHGFVSNLSHCSCQIGAMRFRASDKAKALYLAPLKAWAYQSDSRSFLGLKVITALQGFNHHGQRARQPKTIQNTLMSDHLKYPWGTAEHCAMPSSGTVSREGAWMEAKLRRAWRGAGVEPFKAGAPGPQLAVRWINTNSVVWMFMV